MISQTAEYALRAVVCLAQQPELRMTTPQIAKITRVPAGYLSKVLQALGRAGIVRSQRGLGGGFSLVRPPAEITVLEIVNAVDPLQRIRTCPLNLAAHGAKLCPLHKRLDDALASVEEAFGATYVDELLAEPTSSSPLCDFPGDVVAIVDEDQTTES